MKNKQLFRVLSIVFAIALAVFFIGCNEDVPKEKPTPPLNKEEVSVKGYEKVTTQDTVRMNNKVVYVKEDINKQFLSKDTINNVITFKSGTELNIIKEGDIIFSEPTKENPDGYALKVKEKQQKGGTTVYSYDYATMDEVFDDLALKMDIEPEMSKESIVVYDPFVEEPSGGRGKAKKSSSGLNIGKIIGFDSDRFKSIKFTKNSASLKYVVWDADRNFKKTTDDQIICTIELNFDNSNSNISLKRTRFRAYGYPTFGVKLKFEYNFDSSTDKKLKEYWKKEIKKQVFDKKVKLIDIPLSPVSPTSLAFKPTFSIYARLGLSAEAKLTTEFSYDDLQLFYNVQSYKDDTNSRFNISLNKKGTPHISLDASVEGQIKLGLGAGIFLKFPQFHYAKHQPSYIGIQGEGVFKGTLKAKGSAIPGNGLKCQDFTLETRADFNLGIEGKLGIFRSKFVDVDYGDFLTYPIKDPWSIDFNTCRAENYKSLTLSTNTINLHKGTSINVNITAGSGNYIVSSSNNSVATAVLKGNTITLTGKARGAATVTVTDTKTNKTAQIAVTVTAPAIPALTLSTTSVSIARGAQASVQVTAGSGSYAVSSSNNSVATAVLKGSIITLTGKARGTATVTVTDTQTYKTAQIAVTVNSSGTTEVPEGVVIQNGVLKKWPCDKIPANGHITIPNSVTVIGELVFRRCVNLRSINIPNSVTLIEKGAFSNCSQLISLNLPNSLTSIGNGAFTNCSQITSINLPSSLTSIGQYAFFGCENLTEITIPSSVTRVGRNSFRNCSRLTTIYCNPTTPPVVDAYNFGLGYNKKLIVPKGTKDKYAHAEGWKDCNPILEDSTDSPSVPEGVIIENGILKKWPCNKIPADGHVTIPNSVTTIGDYAFFGCRQLTSVTIPNSVTTIGYSAFFNCSNLISVVIPNSIIGIGNNAFSGCKRLTSVTIPNSVTAIGMYAFRDCSSLTSVIIPNSVTKIHYGVFLGCSQLTSVTIPNSVTIIGSSAFRGCGRLTSITIPNSVTKIGTEVFYKCSRLTTLYCKATTPPTVNGSLYYSGKLIVPKGTKAKYAQARGWNSCNPIVEEE